MGAWDIYESRMREQGNSRRSAALRRESRYLNSKVPDNLSYTSVIIHPMEYGYNIDDDEMYDYAFEQNVAIIDSDNLNEKKMHSMPGEDIELGSLIHWEDNYWLVTERDANTTVYTTVKLLQCNHLLHWIDIDSREIMSQWCVIEDGTKLYMDSFRTWRHVCKKTHRIAGTP